MNINNKYQRNIKITHTRDKIRKAFEKMGLIDIFGIPIGYDDWVDPENWEGIMEGMTEDEVVAILGFPDETFENPRYDEKGFLYLSKIAGVYKSYGTVSFRNGVVVEFMPATIPAKEVRRLVREQEEKE